MAQTKHGASLIAAKKAEVTHKYYQDRIAAGEKWCTLCRQFHPTTRFGKDSSRIDGLSPSCRESRNKFSRDKYEPTTRVIARGRRFVLARPGDKKQARRRVNYLVEIGELPHPNDLLCVDCNHKHDGVGRHEYDHYDGYSGESQEMVEPVCGKCHYKREKIRNGNK